MGEIIRRAERRDIPRLVYLGEEFALLSQPIHGFNVSRATIIEFTNEIVNESFGVVFVLEIDGTVQGFIAGIIQKIYFSKDVALQELAWYVKKDFKGINLFKTFEAYGKAIGCQQIIVGNKPAYCDLSHFYERHEFHLLENQYAKRLN